MPPDLDWDERQWELWCKQWDLEPNVIHLNHGSFGPAPRPVLAARQKWMTALQRNPMDFFMRKLEKVLETVREKLATFVGARPSELAFVENATTGMNVVAQSFPLQPGDEVLLNDHEYGAVLRIWERACQRTGAKLVVASLPCPVVSEQQVVECLLEPVSPRTKLIVFSHITSPTAIVMPVDALCREARRLNLAVAIDGPHAPAVAALELNRWDCDYYTASCHKWLCAPFGSGFLYVHPRRQAEVQPLVTSWGRTPEGKTPCWQDEFDWHGTHDPSAQLSIADSLSFFEQVGFESFREQTHSLAAWGRRKLTQLTGLPPLTPDSRQWFGSMTAIELPPGPAQPLQQALKQQYNIEVPVFEWQNRRLLRLSCHLYNHPRDIETLVAALPKFWR